MSGASGATAKPVEKFNVTFNKNHAKIIIISLLILSLLSFGLNMGLYGNTTNDFVKECKKPSTECNFLNKEGNKLICPSCSNLDVKVGDIEYEEQPRNCLIKKSNAFKDHVANTGYWYVGLAISFLLYIVFIVFFYMYKIKPVTVTATVSAVTSP
jgi:hypothetical protein